MRSDDPDRHSCPQCAYPLPEPDRRDLDEILASMTMDNPEFRARVEASRKAQEAEMRRTSRYPTIEDYRKVYASLARDGVEWPGDDEIRRMYTGLIAP